MEMARVSCRVSLATGEILESEILEPSVEVDATEYVAYKLNEILDLHKKTCSQAVS